MPLVSATDVPGGASLTGSLPQAPTQVPGDYQNIRAGPESFGALQGQALEHVGTTLETAADRLAANAIQAQQLHNQVAVHAAGNHILETSTDALYGTETTPGYFTLQGEAAVRAYPGMRDQLRKLYSDTRNSLQNPIQQDKFDDEVRRNLSYQLQQMGRHYDLQQKNYADATEKAAHANGMGFAAANVDDDVGFNLGVQKAMQADIERVRLAGGGTEQLDMALTKTRADATAMRAGSIGVKDPAAAQAYIDQPENKALLLPSGHYETLSARFRPHIDHDAGVAAGDAALGAAGFPGVPGAPTRGGQFRAPPGPAIAGASAAEQQILNEVRHRENSGNYGKTDRADDNGGGAYQFLDSTWKEATAKAGIGTQYARGSDAPKDVQDAVALAHYRDKGITPWNKSGPYPSAGGSGAPSGPVVQDFQTRVSETVAHAAESGIILKPGQPSRTHEEQQKLYDADVAAHGGKPSGMVAKPGSSQHEVGLANDFHTADGRKIVAGSAEDRWLQANAEDHGLVRPVKGEPWHIEPVGGRTASATQPVRNPQTGKIEQVPRPPAPGTQVAQGPSPTFTDAGTSGGPMLGPSGLTTAQLADQARADASGQPRPAVTPAGPAAEVAADVAAEPAPPGAPTAPTGAPTTTPTTPTAALPRLPSIQEVIEHIPTTNPKTGLPLTPEQYQFAQNHAVQKYHAYMQATEESRARLENDLKNGAQMLADGKDFPYDEANIRNHLPPEKADPIIEGLQDAKTIGAAKIKIAGMTPQEIATERDRLNAEKAIGPTSGYIQRSKDAAAFAIAGYKHYQDLDADPSLYVARNNPRIGALQAASGQGPQAFSDYAIASLTEQTRLGVPLERRHILGTSEAPAMVNKIMADPENAPMIMRQLAAQSGTSWDQVWRDLTTVGKMPAAFQAVGTLENEADAGILAKALGVGVKDEKSWDQILPQTARNDIRTAIDGSTEVSDLLRSLSQSGSSGTQVAGVKTAIEMLAYGKRFYHQDPNAAAHAITAFTENYEFMPNGGGRVPSKIKDIVSSNAANTLFALEPGGIKIPEVLTSPTPIPGSANTDDYMRQLKANPSWITAPTGDALWLMDPQGRIVRYRDNVPVSVPFTGPSIVTTPPAFGFNPGQTF